jgi:hypothetical protein
MAQPFLELRPIGLALCALLENGGEWRWFRDGPFPSFQRRGGCASKEDPLSLAAQTGWLVKVREVTLYARPEGAPFLKG